MARGWSLDCVRVSQMRAVIFHIYTQNILVYLEGCFSEDMDSVYMCVYVPALYMQICIHVCIFFGGYFSFFSDPRVSSSFPSSNLLLNFFDSFILISSL